MRGDGVIRAVCLGLHKGQSKTPVAQGRLVREHGLEGDAHAGPGPRQISLLARESADKLRDRLPTLADGSFGENLTTEGIDLCDLPPGTRLRVGERALLEVTQIGKSCHAGCEISRQVGDCVMPREGIFARVVNGGVVRPGDHILVVAPAAALD